MLDPKRAHLIALENAVEDWSGLYEIIWDYDARCAGATESEKLQAGIGAVLDLLTAGFIEVAFAPGWPPPRYDPVPADQCPAVIRDPQSWRPPAERPNASFFAIGATEIGRQAYFSLTPEEADLLSGTGAA
jgi:hypothetical protein